MPDDRNPKAKPALQNLSLYPEAGEGQKRIVIILPKKAREEDSKVELLTGKDLLVDGCNHYFMNGAVAVGQVAGFGYDYYTVTSNGEPGATLMTCPDGKKKTAFVSVINENLIRYNSQLPVVLYVPQDFEVKYRVWTAGKPQIAAKSTPDAKPKGIRACPDALIVNKMPVIGKAPASDRYYIYQGVRREISAFDTTWLRKNCPKIRTEEVQ